MAPSEKVKCTCGCEKIVSLDTERRHRKNKASSILQASAAAKGKGPLASLLTPNLRTGGDLSTRPRVNFTPPTPLPVPGPIASTSGTAPDVCPMDIDESDSGGSKSDVNITT